MHPPGDGSGNSLQSGSTGMEDEPHSNFMSENSQYQPSRATTQQQDDRPRLPEPIPRTPQPVQHRPTFASSRSVSSRGRDGLADTVMRTLVSNGNEALDLLYCAAEQGIAESPPPTASASGSYASRPAVGYATPATVSSATTHHQSKPVGQSDVRRVWDVFKFVKMGWFSSEEAIFYMDR
jgi:hypothetical protein